MLGEKVSGTIVLWYIKELSVYIIETPVGDKREIGAEDIYRNSGWKFFNNVKKYKPTDIRSSVHFKQDPQPPPTTTTIPQLTIINLL